MEPFQGDSYLVSTRALDYARVNEVFYPGGMRQDRHRHNSASSGFVASTRYEERIGREAHSLTTSPLVYHPHGEWHAVAFERDVRIFSIEFRGQTMSDSVDLGSTHRSELVAWLGSRLAREMTRVDSASTLAIDGLLSEMLAEGSRGKVLSEEKG